jgi:DHA2 family multidrug resistance protein
VVDPYPNLKSSSVDLASACFMMFAFGLGLFGTIAIQPMMLENLFGYTAETAGFVMAPRGIASAIGMFMVSRLINRYDLRLIILVGFALSATGTWMLSQLSLNAAPHHFVTTGILQGLGMGMIFVPLSTLAYRTLPKSSSSEAAGIYNLSRTIGSSVGISVASSVLSHTHSMSEVGLSRYITPDNPAVSQWLATQGLTLDSPSAVMKLSNLVSEQAMMIAFNDTFYMVMWSFIVMIPLLMLIKGHSPKASAPSKK